MREKAELERKMAKKFRAKAREHVKEFLTLLTEI
jgi:hypothetical protein